MASIFLKSSIKKIFILKLFLWNFVIIKQISSNETFKEESESLKICVSNYGFPLILAPYLPLNFPKSAP